MIGNRRIIQLLELDRFQEARDLAIESLAEIPQDAVMHCNHGTALAGLGQPEEALAATENAITLDHTNSKFFEQQAMLLSKLGRHSKAHEAFERSLSLSPSDSFTKAAFIEALLREPASSRPTERTARLNQANVLVESMLENEPDGEASHLMKSKVLLAQKRYAPAQQAARQALRINPNSAIGHQLIGLTQENQGNIRAAGDSYVAAGKIDPRSSHSRDLLGGLGKGAAAAPIGIGIMLLSRLGRVSSREASDAGVPAAAIIIVVLVVVAGIIAYRRHDRVATTPDLSLEAKRVYEANKKLS